MTTTIVDYKGGNLRSVQRACEAVGIDARIGSTPDDLRHADRIIFPGVGNAQTAMEELLRSGLEPALRQALHQGTPILGICVGAQLILESSEESEIPCLGFLPGVATRFQPTTPDIKVPHIGWNDISIEQPHPLLEGLTAGAEFYFVHSYFPQPSDPSLVYATADYGGTFCCALGRDNLFATQFHPEKSGKLGLALLTRFSTWDGQPC